MNNTHMAIYKYRMNKNMYMLMFCLFCDGSKNKKFERNEIVKKIAIKLS